MLTPQGGKGWMGRMLLAALALSTRVHATPPADPAYPVPSSTQVSFEAAINDLASPTREPAARGCKCGRRRLYLKRGPLWRTSP
jgi:hypothetical protein